MKVTCGADIIEIERIKNCIEDSKTGKAFLERVFTKNEIDYCESKKMQKYQHYAVRFAGKEAVFKALSELIEDKYSINWTQIEILNNIQGRPEVNLIGIKFEEVQNIDISMSHCKGYAVANVVCLIENLRRKL